MGFQAWLEAAPPGDGDRACDRPCPARRREDRPPPATPSPSVFVLNGLASRRCSRGSPTSASGLGLDNGPLGLLLLSGCRRLGAGHAQRSGAAHPAVRGRHRGPARAPCWSPVGLVVVAIGVDRGSSVAVAAVGLFVYGVGTGVWDVAMNVEGAAVERRLGRDVMPRFHAGWSLGTVAGAGLGVLVPRWASRCPLHLALSVRCRSWRWLATRTFLPRRAGEPEPGRVGTVGLAGAAHPGRSG